MVHITLKPLNLQVAANLGPKIKKKITQVQEDQ